MANCTNCGKPLDEGVKFCASCGAAVKDGSTNWTATTPGQALQNADPRDVEENKTMAIIAYFLFFVPLITGDYKKSEFVRFHTNQATVLFIASAIVMTVSSMLVIILIGLVLMPLFGICCLVFFIIGIINAVNGVMKPLPIIGKFEIIK